MSQHDDFDRSLARWFDAEARPAATADVLDRALRATRRRRPRPRLFAALGSHWVGDSVGPTSGAATLGRTGLRTSMALLLLLLVLALVAGAVLVGARLLQPAPVDLGIFEPISGGSSTETEAGSGGSTRHRRIPGRGSSLTAEAGIPLGWSRDGTKLLVLRGGSPGAQLFVLHADGSETKLTTTDDEIEAASIAPDGSRVVFEGVTATPEGECCRLFAVRRRRRQWLGRGARRVSRGHLGGTGLLSGWDADRIRRGSGDNGHSVSVDGRGRERRAPDPRQRHNAGGGPYTTASRGRRLAIGSRSGYRGRHLHVRARWLGLHARRGVEGETCGAADPCAVKLPSRPRHPTGRPTAPRSRTRQAALSQVHQCEGCHLASRTRMFHVRVPSPAGWSRRRAPVASRVQRLRSS